MTIESGFDRVPIQSTATSEAQFTEQEFSWIHTGGTTGSGSFLVCFVGAIDSSSEGSVQALEATFSGATNQMLTLAHELTGDGKAFPSIHAFTLTSPQFSGTGENSSGTITVRMNEVVSNVNALSVVYTGVNTTSLGYLSGSFTDRIEHNITSTGTLSGTIPSSPGDLLVDCVVANAGLPDDHTLGTDQILSARLAINTGGSSKISVSHKFASTAEHTHGMQRSDITALETVSETKFAIEMD
jgi:hypothetical protein